MNSNFERLMAQATRLTQSGDLHSATAAIQAALGARLAGAAGASARHAGATDANDEGDAIDVIDVEARELPGDAAPASRPEVPPYFRPAPPAPKTSVTLDGSHTEAGLTRAYKLYVPPVYQGQALPLVVMLHGCTQDPDDFAAGTGMTEAARSGGFFVLYPAQAQSANPSRCWNWFKHNHQGRDRGEPALLAGMTRAVMERYKIDPQRVFVAGLSAGGAMAAILGDAYPELFAAVGVHSGLPTGAATDMPSAFVAMSSGATGAAPAGQAPPTIVFHGDQDSTVHPLNGEHVVAARAGAGRSEVERARSANGHEYTRHVYRDEGGKVHAEHWVVHGSGHAWSGGDASGSYTDAQGPSATQEMLRFFLSR